jgi:hypothetical protein
MLLTEKQFRKIVGGKIFTVKFKKKDGTIRTLNGRLGVKKHLRGGKIRFNASEKNNVIVYDLKNKGYRSFNLSRLNYLKCGGEVVNES